MAVLVGRAKPVVISASRSPRPSRSGEQLGDAAPAAMPTAVAGGTMSEARCEANRCARFWDGRFWRKLQSYEVVKNCGAA